MAEGTGAANLAKVEHVVVLMMENGSFDHMLGYLSLEGGRTDVGGLRPEFASTRDGRRYPVRHLGATAIATDPGHSADAVDVPVCDHLAREFAIGGRWFSPVPGATWPNRLYALCGRAAGSRDDRPPRVPPICRQPSFVRHLDARGVSWRWYSSGSGTLRLAGVHYRLSRPDFSDFNPIGFQPSDDHAPADIRDGRQFVPAICHALASGPQRGKTLLIIFCDEHGGFFDHVPPPAAPDDDPRMSGRYGVRVPALIVSPRTGPGVVSHPLSGHTSIITAILLRSCPDAPGQPAGSRRFGWVHRGGHPHPAGARVAQARDPGELLTRATPRLAPDRYALIGDAAAQAAARPKGAAIERDALARQPSTGLQRRMAAANKELRRLGHPADRP
jgi:phospholipase C